VGSIQFRYAQLPLRFDHVKNFRRPDGFMLPGSLLAQKCRCHQYRRRSGFPFFLFQTLRQIFDFTDLEGMDTEATSIDWPSPISYLPALSNLPPDLAATTLHFTPNGGEMPTL
jgi:hypothetical protein